MTSLEGLSIAMTGLSVLGSARSMTTSWPPERPTSARRDQPVRAGLPAEARARESSEDGAGLLRRVAGCRHRDQQGQRDGQSGKSSLHESEHPASASTS